MMTPEEYIADALAPPGMLFDWRGPDYIQVAVMFDWKKRLADAIRAAVAQEREECAKVAEAYRSEHNGMLAYLEKGLVNDITCGSIAAAIRARGE